MAQTVTHSKCFGSIMYKESYSDFFICNKCKEKVHASKYLKSKSITSDDGKFSIIIID